MKQRKNNDKRQNITNMKNKRTVSSVDYKRIKQATKDYQKNSHNNQADNKDNNRNIDISIGLGEEKLKTKTKDQKGREPIITKRSSHNNSIIVITYILIPIAIASIRSI